MILSPALNHRRFSLLWAGLMAQAFGVPFAILSGGVSCIAAAVFIGMRWPQLCCYNKES